MEVAETLDVGSEVTHHRADWQEHPLQGGQVGGLREVLQFIASELSTFHGPPSGEATTSEVLHHQVLVPLL